MYRLKNDTCTKQNVYYVNYVTSKSSTHPHWHRLCFGIIFKNGIPFLKMDPKMEIETSDLSSPAVSPPLTARPSQRNVRPMPRTPMLDAAVWCSDPTRTISGQCIYVYAYTHIHTECVYAVLRWKNVYMQFCVYAVWGKFWDVYIRYFTKILSEIISESIRNERKLEGEVKNSVWRRLRRAEKKI